MGTLFPLLILIFAILVPVHAEQTYESERETMYEKALLNGNFNDEFLIRSVFDSDLLEFDVCDMMAEALEGEEFECDLEPVFHIEGMSEKGREVLMSASKAYESYQLDLRDEEARLLVALCETGINVPSAIASEKAGIRGSIFELELRFYEQVVGELDESDVLRLERHNSEAYGTARPAMNHAHQQIEKILAERFPQQYREAHLKQCVTAIENKGLPFKRFRREPYREDCEQTTHSYGADGERIVSTSLPMVDGCMKIEYFAQKPEKPSDEELTYE